MSEYSMFEQKRKAMIGEFAEVTTAVTLERICTIFDQEDWKYRAENGELVTAFDGKVLGIQFSKEDAPLILVSKVKAQAADLFQEDLLGFIEEWHRNKIMLKAYLSTGKDGSPEICLEQALLFAAEANSLVGATDSQLKLYISEFISLVCMFHVEFQQAFGKGVQE